VGAEGEWDVGDEREQAGPARLDLLDCRRVAALYAVVRAEPAPATAHALWVAERADLIRGHPQSPVAADARDAFELDAAPYDPAYRFVVPVLPAPPERRDVPTALDGVVVLERCGRVELPDLGGLDVWWVAAYGGGVFLPFRDPAATSYGGGRYLLDTVKGADLGGPPDALVVDLNFAYPPSCAYDVHWVCPLPGPGNTLATPVPVGERGPGLTA
jgi:uncharacterized protein (DUF1684 family)